MLVIDPKTMTVSEFLEFCSKRRLMFTKSVVTRSINILNGLNYESWDTPLDTPGLADNFSGCRCPVGAINVNCPNHGIEGVITMGPAPRPKETSPRMTEKVGTVQGDE